jgi:hypothetical protein
MVATVQAGDHELSGDTMVSLICLLSPTEAWFSLLNVTSDMRAESSRPMPVEQERGIWP